MNSKFLKYLFLTCFSLISIFVFAYNDKFSILKNNVNLFSTLKAKLEPFIDRNHLSFCEKSDEWTVINDEIFIRTKSARYFMDKKTLQLFFTCRINGNKNIEYQLKTAVSYKGKQVLSGNLNNLRLRKIFSVEMLGYEDWQLNLDLDLNYLVKNTNFDIKNLKISFNIILFNKTSNFRSESSVIHSNVGYYRKTKFRHFNSIVCTEPIYLEKKDFKEFEWWVELNRLIGYEKIVIFNNSIPNTIEFNNLFEQNKNFIDLYQLNCLPNFVIEGREKFLRHYRELIIHGIWKYENNKFLAIDILANNECFYHYTDSAKLIFLIDNDETFIPSKLKNFQSRPEGINFFSQKSYFESKSDVDDFKKNILNRDLCNNYKTENKITEFLDEVYSKNTLDDDFSILIPPAVYGHNPLVEIIFDKVEKMLNTEEINFMSNKMKFPIKMPNVIYLEIQNFTIVINDLNEFIYAKNMLYIYKNFIRPFLTENKEKLEKMTERFTKFYNFKVEVLQSFYGKDFNNPDRVTYMDPHESNGVNFELKDQQLSHFRDIMNTKKSGDYPITNIYLDLNYYLCYFLPIYEKLGQKY